MKKILLAITVLAAAFLCFGCQAEEETKTLNYEQMDKEFGQHKDSKAEKDEEASKEFEEDMPEIEKCVKEYVYCLIYGDANRYARTFPNDYIIAIMEQEGCSWDTAVDISSTKIWETFNGVENRYTEIRELNGIHGHEFKVKTVTRFGRESALIKVYAGYNLYLTDVVEINFEVSSLDKKADGYMRLVKMKDGKWQPDMSYFKI